MNKSIARSINRLDKARADLKQVVLRECMACKHGHIAECDDSPPWRICLDCGLTEEGWHCGYEVLDAPEERVGSIYQDKMLNLRTASLWQRDHGEPLQKRIAEFLGLKMETTEAKS